MTQIIGSSTLRHARANTSPCRLGLDIFRRAYTAGPGRYGRYPILLPETAMTAYPDPLPVSISIPRPRYVPSNFFTAGWGDHEQVSYEDGRVPDGPLGDEGERGVKEAGAMAAEILGKVQALIKPGLTTSQIDEFVHSEIISCGAYPSTLGYMSYPRSCTISVNNVIAHGIPDEQDLCSRLSRPLHPEDLVNVDLTLYYKGYHGDTSATFLLPDIDRQGRNLSDATKEALELGIRACGPGKRLNAIGKDIDDFAKRHGFSVNAQFCGHGIGRNFHQRPDILHFNNNESGVMQPGDCFTIEPSLLQGSNARGFMWDDGWTMATESGARSAQFEHQVLITHDGVQVLTRRAGEQT